MPGRAASAPRASGQARPGLREIVATMRARPLVVVPLVYAFIDRFARATVLGAFNAAGALGFIVGPLVAGGVSQWVAGSHGWQTGYSTAFVVAGLSEVLCVALTIPWLRRLSALRGRRDSRH